MPDFRASSAMLPQLCPSPSSALPGHAVFFLLSLLILLHPATGLGDDELDVQRIASDLEKESVNGWPHLTTSFLMVTQKDGSGRQQPVDWQAQDGFERLQPASGLDHTQRATFMGRVAEVVQLWANRRRTPATYELAKRQWDDVLRYAAWEVKNFPENAPAPPPEIKPKATVLRNLRSLRDIATYTKVYSHVCATQGGPVDAALVAALAESAAAKPENVGVFVLRNWRKHLIKVHRCRDGQEAVDSGKPEVIEDWKKFVQAVDAYLKVPERGSLGGEFEDDVLAFPAQP